MTGFHFAEELIEQLELYTWTCGALDIDGSWPLVFINLEFLSRLVVRQTVFMLFTFVVTVLKVKSCDEIDF